MLEEPDETKRKRRGRSRRKRRGDAIGDEDHQMRGGEEKRPIFISFSEGFKKIRNMVGQSSQGPGILSHRTAV